MGLKQKNGLLAIWADIEKSYDTEFRKWHNCQHVMERLSIQGFIAAYRYCGLASAPAYFMFYETYDSKVLGSEEYLKSVNNPTQWTKESLKHFRNTVRNIYSEIYIVGKKPRVLSPYLYLSRFSLPKNGAEKVLETYKKKYMDKIIEFPDVFGARLFESDLEISGIGSGEMKLHRAIPAKQPFLAIYEMASLEVVSSKKFSQIGSDCQILKNLENLTNEKYWIDYTVNMI